MTKKYTHNYHCPLLNGTVISGRFVGNRPMTKEELAQAIKEEREHALKTRKG